MKKKRLMILVGEGIAAATYEAICRKLVQLGA